MTDGRLGPRFKPPSRTRPLRRRAAKWLRTALWVRSSLAAISFALNAERRSSSTMRPRVPRGTPGLSGEDDIDDPCCFVKNRGREQFLQKNLHYLHRNCSVLHVTFRTPLGQKGDRGH